MGCCKCKDHKWADPQPPVWTDPADGKEYCVFHAPVEHKGISDIKFNKTVYKRIQDARKNERGNLHLLDGTIFPGAFEASLLEIDFALCIRNAIFAEEITLLNSMMQDLIFDSCVFKKQLYLMESKFNGGIFFTDTVFENRVSFSGSTFKCDVRFQDSIFMKNLLFNEAYFEDKITFHSSTFHDQIHFRNVTLYAPIIFYKSKFNGNLFLSALQKSDIDFSSCIFTECATISAMDTSCNSLISFNDIDIDRCNIHFKRICGMGKSRLNFNNTINVANLHFENCQWPEEKGRIKVAAEDEPGQLQAKRDFYQRMKRKYKDEHNEYEASRWHVSEKEAQLKLLRRAEEYPRLWAMLWREPGAWFLFAMLWLYRQASGFGENPGRAGLALLGLVVLPLLALGAAEVAGHFVWWSWDWGRVDAVVKDWLRFLPLTSTRGLESVPGWRHALMVLWQLLVTVQAALFAFALRNRFRR